MKHKNKTKTPSNKTKQLVSLACRDVTPLVQGFPVRMTAHLPSRSTEPRRQWAYAFKVLKDCQPKVSLNKILQNQGKLR